ncbi:hypothetical protein AK812_SmicGene20739 [Symbiodinium microadriaticum]|uniref:Cyclic nucleotide-binding domain-containing protein n=1 Tax=Symbiodinium microadriaticum TaxID=2951 RepID=A0A1Q9DPA0_SYMMI|nr:hypothetical protein AK812_SmicGene20739 [Symbiodinium microadriaticum]
MGTKKDKSKDKKASGRKKSKAKKKEKHKSKKAHKHDSSSSCSSSTCSHEATPKAKAPKALDTGIAQEIRAALKRRAEGESATDVATARDDAWGRHDARKRPKKSSNCTGTFGSVQGPECDLEHWRRQNTSFLKNCDPSFLTRMAQHLEKQVFMAGQPLLEEDVDAGVACVEKAGKVVAKIGAGEFIGELVALGFATAASQTIRAEERVLAFAINNDAFRELVDEFPEAVSVVAAFQKNEERRSSRSLTGEGALLQPEDTQQAFEVPAGDPVPPDHAAGSNVPQMQQPARLRKQILLGTKGYRPPEKGPGTLWSAQSQRQAMPASVMRLRKFKKLYGRPPASGSATPIALLATEDTGSSTAARPRPLELNDDGKDEAAVTMAPSMFEQMQKWFSAVQGDEEELLKDYASIFDHDDHDDRDQDEDNHDDRHGHQDEQGAIDKTACEERSPIEKLSLFLQQAGTASKSAAAADEPNIVDLDYSSREGGEGWLALDIADREGLNLTQDVDKINTLFRKVDELSKLVASQSSKPESSSPEQSSHRTRVEASGADPWARYKPGTNQQRPTVEPLSPYSDTDYNHVILGGWEFDTPRRIIVSDVERVLSAFTPEQRTFIKRHVVFGQRAQTAHLFLKEMTDPQQSAERFYNLQGDHNKVHRTTGGSDIWFSPSRTEERRLKNRITTLAGETVLRLLSTEFSKPEIEYNYQKQLVWADGARIAAVTSELLFARPEDRISTSTITDSKGEGMKFYFNLSVLCSKTNKTAAEMEIQLHESQAAAS